MTTVIIGGGAAGIAAALAAAQQGQRVLVLERNRKPLKKLGVTGNGRANVLNAGAPVYFGGEAFALETLRAMDYPALRAFFATVGVPLRVEDAGRVYPASFQAVTVVDALLLRARQLGVQFSGGTLVTALSRDGKGFTLQALQTEPEPESAPRGKATARAVQPPARKVTFCADRVIVTVGGAAAPVHGTDGGGYPLLTAFGHPLSPIRPALCALRTDARRIAGLAGQRVRARLRLLSPTGETLRATGGELLFADDAFSGIAAMQLARFVIPGACVALDLRPAVGLADEAEAEGGATSGEVAEFLRGLCVLRKDQQIGSLFTGALSTPVARLLLREAGFQDTGAPVARLQPDAINKLVQTLADLRLPVTGTRGFDQAQVTAGGILTDGFDPATMESRLCRGLYAAGEVLDVDGDCGGFNLMFAFASGLLAGRAGGGAR